MKRFLALVAGALSISFSSIALADKPVTIRFSNFAGPTSFLTKGIFEPLIQDIQKDSDGTLKIQMFSGGTLVKPEDAFDAVRRGVVDMAWSLTGYNPGRFIAAGVTEFPLQAQNVREGSEGVWALYEAGLADGFDGVYVFGLSSSAVALLHSGKKASSLDDFKGERVRAAGPLASASIEALGLTPIGLPASQVAENLSKRVLAGSVNDWVALHTWQIADFVNYHIDVPLGAATAYVIINQKKYNSLPEKAKAALQQHGGKAFVARWSTALEAENQRIKAEVLEDKKHVIVTPSQEDLERYSNTVQAVVQEWIKNTDKGQEIWDTYTGAIEKTRAE